MFGDFLGCRLGGFVVGVVEVFLQGYLPESVAPYREAISLSNSSNLLRLRSISGSKSIWKQKR